MGGGGDEEWFDPDSEVVEVAGTGLGGRASRFVGLRVVIVGDYEKTAGVEVCGSGDCLAI